MPNQSDWFPGRVSRAYKDNYTMYGHRKGWCSCGCKMISGICVACGDQNNTQLDEPEIGGATGREGGF